MEGLSIHRISECNLLLPNQALLTAPTHHKVECSMQAYNGTSAKWVWSAIPLNIVTTPSSWSGSLDKLLGDCIT